MLSPTSARTPVVPATSKPVAASEAPEKLSLVGKVSHAADAFAGALNRDLGVLGSAARKDLLHFPWPGKGSAGRPGWITRQDPTPTTDVTGQFRTLNAQASHGESVLPADAGKYKYLVIGGLF